MKDARNERAAPQHAVAEDMMPTVGTLTHGRMMRRLRKEAELVKNQLSIEEAREDAGRARVAAKPSGAVLFSHPSNECLRHLHNYLLVSVSMKLTRHHTNLVP